jgi:hypothetical protein
MLPGLIVQRLSFLTEGLRCAGKNIVERIEYGLLSRFVLHTANGVPVSVDCKKAELSQSSGQKHRENAAATPWSRGAAHS